MASRNITFLGTGAADATKYYHSCFYVRDEKTGLLVDTGGGGGILAQLEKASIPLEDIRFLFITHKHMDHLLGVFWILRFLGSKISKGTAEGLTIFAPEKVIKAIRDVSPIFLKEKITGLYDEKIQFKSINDGKEFSLGEWTIKPFDLQSKKEEQFGFRLTFKDGVSVVCLGDEPYKDTLLEQCKGADYFIHDAFCLERDRERFSPHEIHHATVKGAAEAGERAGAKNLVLVHTEDKATFGIRKELYTKESKKYFNGAVFVPNDLEVLEI